MENPFDPEKAHPQLLIIFDGLDELAKQGKLSEETAKEFVREVEAKIRILNQAAGRFLQVLITGRDVAVQTACSRNPERIYHVLPYFTPESKREGDNGEQYGEGQDRLEEDLRNTWWQKYGAVTQKGYEGMPAELNRKNLEEITGQPLLNYLVALTYVGGGLNLSDATTLNSIYANLLDKVYERGYEGSIHRAIDDIEKPKFVRILEEISLAAWHGDGRTTTVSEIQAHCKSSGLMPLLKTFEEGAKAGVTRLFLAFYFRQSGSRNNEATFEFTHKSFGEYLTAVRIVRAMAQIQKQLDRREEDIEEGWDEQEALVRWAQICGPTRMDTYLLDFVRNEVALRPEEEVAKWQKTFAYLIEVMLKYGMPMEDVRLPLKFHKANQWAIHAEECLLVALNACARVTNDVSEIQWPDQTALGAWLARLRGQRNSEENVVALMCLGHLKLSNVALDFADLYGAKLEGATLYGATLYGATLYGATLTGANLYRANLYGANLYRANLERANLERANLERANLYGANLYGAILYGAKLERASLERANLYGAKGLTDNPTLPEEYRSLVKSED